MGESPDPAGSPSPDTLQILLGPALEVSPKTGKAKGGIDPPAAAWELIWTLRAAGVRLGIDTDDPNYINLRPASLVSAAQRERLELLSYDIWWLLGAAPTEPGELAPRMPWPAELPGLGPRRIGPYASCLRCGTGSWARYGSIVYCLPHAQDAARDAWALVADLCRHQPQRPTPVHDAGREEQTR
jgi:hypothetical protein